MRLPRRAAAFALLLAAACSSSDAREVEISIRYSRFAPAEISVAAGTTVRFTVVNRDPIAHEMIIGDEAEQERHERGHDVTHDGTPGAASLAPGETDRITYTFDEPGALLFACHLPGHYRYGMVGTIRVT